MNIYHVLPKDPDGSPFFEYDDFVSAVVMADFPDQAKRMALAPRPRTEARAHPATIKDLKVKNLGHANYMFVKPRIVVWETKSG